MTGRGVSGGKVKIGNPANHSIMLVKFLGTFSGLQDAEKLQKYFTENKRGRIDFEKKASDKGKSSKSGEGKKGGELEELVLYGYMGIAEDLDQIDYDTKRKCSIKSKKEIQDIADAPVKPEWEGKKWYEDIDANWDTIIVEKDQFIFRYFSYTWNGQKYFLFI